MISPLASALILKSAPGSSIQDLGRVGQADFGVPISGAMDQRSMLWINHLLQNHKNDAVLEISQPGFSIQFSSPTRIALAGATVTIKVNGSEVKSSGLVTIKAKDLLEIGAFSSGSRVYLGIKFGFQSEEILNSRSFYGGLTKTSQLSKGEKLTYFTEFQDSPTHHAMPKWSPDWYFSEILQAYPGPDFPLLTEEVKEKLLSQTFTISQLSNRMGIQLSELLENNLPEQATNPVFPGTVQLTSGGKLILLLRDAQVTGGYPRILHLDEESQWIITQKTPGSRIGFKLKKP